MNDAICSWASREMYGGRLRAHPSVASHTLADGLAAGGALSGGGGGGAREGSGGGGRGSRSAAAPAAAPASPAPPFPVLLLIDTAGCGMEETVDDEGGGGSKLNDGEARVVMAHVRKLIAAGVPSAAIGVITPYSAQVPQGGGRGGEALKGP